MPIKSYRMGPGTLTIGAVGSPVDFTAQVTACTVAWDKEQEDAQKTLSGEELRGEITYSASLNATLIQDLTDAGLVEWSWANKGSDHPFSFEPSTAVGKPITGVVTVDPIDVGGEVGTKPTSDIEWSCVGEPTIAPGL